jgi:hypothetical protein
MAHAVFNCLEVWGVVPAPLPVQALHTYIVKETCRKHVLCQNNFPILTSSSSIHLIELQEIEASLSCISSVRVSWGALSLWHLLWVHLCVCGRVHTQLSLNSVPTPQATPPALFCDGFFEMGLLNYLPWLALILLISAFWVARIIGVSHSHPASLFVLKLSRIFHDNWYFFELTFTVYFRLE